LLINKNINNSKNKLSKQNNMCIFFYSFLR
jgi:hypothetical protein